MSLVLTTTAWAWGSNDKHQGYSPIIILLRPWFSLYIYISLAALNCRCSFMPTLYMVTIEVVLVTLKKLKLKRMSVTRSYQAVWLWRSKASHLWCTGTWCAIEVLYWKWIWEHVCSNQSTIFGAIRAFCVYGTNVMEHRSECFINISSQSKDRHKAMVVSGGLWIKVPICNWRLDWDTQGCTGAIWCCTWCPRLVHPLTCECQHQYLRHPPLCPQHQHPPIWWSQEMINEVPNVLYRSIIKHRFHSPRPLQHLF